MKYILDEEEYQALRQKADEADRLRNVALEKERYITLIATELSEMTDFTPVKGWRCNGMDCLEIAQSLVSQFRSKKLPSLNWLRG